MSQEIVDFTPLTASEVRILKLIAQDKTSSEIAEFLCKSKRTIDNHRLRIGQKLNLSGNNSLLAFSLKNKNQIKALWYSSLGQAGECLDTHQFVAEGLRSALIEEDHSVWTVFPIVANRYDSDYSESFSQRSTVRSIDWELVKPIT